MRDMLKIVFILLCLCSTSLGVVVQGSFEVTDKYPGGFTARITFPVTRNYEFGWLLNVTFDIVVTNFEVFEGTTIGAHPNNKYYIVRHQEHNKNLHRDASGKKVFYCQGKCKGRPEADIRFISIKDAFESIEDALVRAEESGITGEYPSTSSPPTTTISFLEGWTPPEFTPVTKSTTTTPTTRITTTSTTPPLNLASLNLRYNLREVITKSLLFFEAQRSGALPSSNRIPWRSHSALSDGLDKRLDLSGGYYVDGGFIKYNFPMAFSTTMLAWGVLQFRNAYLASHQIPHVMNALRWSTDYFLKCHQSPFVLYAQVSTVSIDNAYWGRPEDYKGVRPSFKIDRRNPGSDLAAEVAAAMASTAIVFKHTNSTYSNILITHAEQLYTFAVRYPGEYAESVSEASRYRSSNGFHDELAWAAVWLYKATGKVIYLVEAKERMGLNPDQSDLVAFDWDDKRPGVILQLAQITNEIVYKDQIRRFCDSLQPGRDLHYTPRGLIFVDDEGTTGLAANVGVVCLMAANLGINYDIYRQFAHRQLSYILGNTIGEGSRSYIVGFGENAPTSPYHRASSCPNLPAPCTWKNKEAKEPNPQLLEGALVSGPNRWDNFEDNRGGQSSVALHYNAGLQTLAAGILQLQVTGQTFSEPNPQELNKAVSESFSVQHNYGEVLRLSLLFYEAQRAGELPNNNRVPWRRSAFVNDSGPNGEDLSGGYFDAGDYVKFNFPMAYSVTVLAWGLIQYQDAYEHVGEMNNCMRALKWATDYFIKCHVSKYEFYGQVGSGRIDHVYWLTPEGMKFVPRPAFKVTQTRPGTEVVAETAAALAATAIVFKKSDPEYARVLLQHAKELHKFADEFREKYHRSIPDAARFYRSLSGYHDELIWSALWLYSATWDSTYLDYAKLNYRRHNITSSSSTSFYWDDKTMGAQLLLAQITREPQYTEALRMFCDRLLPENGFRYTPRGLVFIDQWAPLRHAAGAAFICLGAANLNVRPKRFRTFAKRQLHYMLGDSGLGSFLVGYGPSPPTRPRHRTSSCPTPPQTCGFSFLRTENRNPHVLSGALVGGPDVNDQFSDDRRNYISNRVALDYNAAFQSAIAALQYLELHPPITSTTPHPTTMTTEAEFVDGPTESLNEEVEIFGGDDDVIGTMAATSIELTSSISATTLPGLVGNVVAEVEPEETTTDAITVLPTREETIPDTTNSLTSQATIPELTTTGPNDTTLATSMGVKQTTPNHVTTMSGGVNSHTSEQNISNFPTTQAEVNVATTPESTTRVPGPVLIQVTPPKQQRPYLDLIVFVNECRPMDVFNLCSFDKYTYTTHAASDRYYCRYEAFKECVDKQGVACNGRIWSSFPFWNTQVARDETYFSDEDLNCKDPKIFAVENCEVRGITQTLSSCYVTSGSQSDNTKCRWRTFGKCVDNVVGHCSNTWYIWKFWNQRKEGFYFNETQRKCGNKGARLTSAFYLMVSSSILTLVFIAT